MKNKNIKTFIVVILSSLLSFSAFADSNEDKTSHIKPSEVKETHVSERNFAEDVSINISNEELDDVFLETLAVN